MPILRNSRDVLYRKTGLRLFRLQKGGTMIQVISDLRHALRSVWKARVFSTVVIFMLTIGIASTTSIATVIESVLYRAFPFNDADRLVMAWSKNRKISWQEDDSVSPVKLADWREQTRTFENLAAFTWYQSANLSAEGTP